MRVPSGRLILAAACCAAVAVVPVSIAQATSTGAALSTGASSGTGAKSSAAVHLIAAPAHPAVGSPVRLSVSAPSAGAAGFAWDLAGRGAFSLHTAAPQTTVSFATPGAHTVAVRFRHGGRTQLGVLSVSVAPRPRPHPDPHPEAHAHHPAGHAHRAALTTHADATGLTGRVTAHVAGDPGVTIADFHFSPATTTIHVGDTITWSNNGPSSHTATAGNGTFNTGILKKGQSASHTFSQAGTFAYVCQIHSFMHGTIVVLARTTSTTPATSTPTTTTPGGTTAAAPTPTGPTLPNTGFNVVAGLFAGLVLLGLGAGLRRTRAR
jgi:LPXTG-motif cell wall-anchored protein